MLPRTLTTLYGMVWHWPGKLPQHNPLRALDPNQQNNWWAKIQEKIQV